MEDEQTAPSALHEGLEQLGFREVSRNRAQRTWQAGVNRFLDFQLQEDGDSLVVTWRFELGVLMLERGWQIGGAETTFQELYPQRDVRVPATADAVAAEIRRTLATMRFDLADPAL